MNPHETSDFTRGIDALRRWWWIPVIAAVAGVLLGLTTRADEQSATFEAVVRTPTVDLSVGALVGPTPPVDALVADLQSPEGVASLGSDADGVSTAVTVALDKSSVSVRGTAADADSARRGTEVYATELASRYQDFVSAEATRVQEALESGILSLVGSSGGVDANASKNAATLAELQVQRQVIASLADTDVEPPTVRQISATSSGVAAVVLLGLAFGLLAAGIVALSGLSTRRLRYRDDIERVTGPHTLLSEVTGTDRGVGTGRVLDRLAASGPITLIPVGGGSIDGVRDQMTSGSGTDVAPAESVAGAERAVPSSGSTVLVVQLGKDTASDLDLAYRESSAAGGTFAGVVAVARKARRRK